MSLIIQIFDWFFRLLIILVVIHVFLTYFLSPYHPVRMAIDRVVEPLLNPIRRILPSTGMIDFSPLVLIILLQILEMVVINLLRSI